MADEPISGLTAWSALSGSVDNQLEILDKNDVTFAATGTNKNVTVPVLLTKYLVPGYGTTLTQGGGGLALSLSVALSEVASKVSSLFTCTTSYANTGASVNLPAAGTYLFVCSCYCNLYADASSQIGIGAQLYDTTNSVAIPNACGAVFNNNGSGGSRVDIYTTFSLCGVYVAPNAATVTLQAAYFITSGTGGAFVYGSGAVSGNTGSPSNLVAVRLF